MKIVTPVSGSFERIGNVRGVRPLFYELERLEREYGVFVPEFDDAIEVGILRELAAHQPVAQPADFVAIEVVDELAHQLRPRRFPRPDPVCLETFENVPPILINQYR